MQTIIENIYVQIGSAIVADGTKYIMRDAITTPILMIISPNTWR